MTGKRGGNPSPWCLCFKQFVGSLHQIVLGPPKKQPEDFVTLPHHGNGKIRNETSPHLRGLRKSDGGKKEKTFLFVAIKCLRK